MNNQMQEFARSTLKDGLAQCTENQQFLFKRMYAHGKVEIPINAVIDQMPDDKLDWAMQQVEGTLKKKASNKQINSDPK